MYHIKLNLNSYKVLYTPDNLDIDGIPSNNGKVYVVTSVELSVRSGIRRHNVTVRVLPSRMLS
jgi:hypothetical protein